MVEGEEVNKNFKVLAYISSQRTRRRKYVLINEKMLKFSIGNIICTIRQNK